METIKIKIPTTNEELKIFNKDICQLEKGCLRQLEEDYRRWIDHNFFLRWGNNKKIYCKFPICCEFCKYVGTKFWHCHNPRSFKQHINISPNDVCSKWEPNMGLMILLWDRLWSDRETGVGFSLEELKKKGVVEMKKQKMENKNQLPQEDIGRGFRLKRGRLIKKTKSGRTREHWMRAFRNKSKRYLKSECEKCKTKDNLTIHHIISVSTAKNVEELNKIVLTESNCVTLCDSCHGKIENERQINNK